MKFINVRLILAREIRDQLRDRRTMFMIFVLPILLYPLMGMMLSQVSQFRRERPTNVLVIGARSLAESPPLFENAGFTPALFVDPDREARLVKLTFASDEPGGNEDSIRTPADARSAVGAGRYDAALYFPADFARRLEAFGAATEERARARAQRRLPEAQVALEVPSPEIIYTTATERSQIAFARLTGVLRHWQEEVGKRNLEQSGIPPLAVRPFEVQSADVAAETSYRGAAIWSKILPVLLLVWAMTGAFYPAVDLCAGEKERGTLETLLSSPAQRSEIVMGKLLTIMLFSMITAALNLLSVGFTGWITFGHLPSFGFPPPLAIVWLAAAVVPVSALFSALCLALAAFARSTKEGQYYLTPLLVVSLPLALLPMAPGVELTLGSSLVPVTGIVLLLRSLLEGSYWPAMQFLPVVVAVTLAACWLAVRWAVEQFNSEAVLFRESERLDLGLRVRHLLRDRQPMPTVAAAVLCGIVILIARFYLGAAMPSSADFDSFLKWTMVTQLAVVLTPALLMTAMLTRSPQATLLLRLPRWQTVIAAAALAVAFHPVVVALHGLVKWLYPMSQDIQRAIDGMQAAFVDPKNTWKLVLVIGLAPAICEELAFRGFILSGFRQSGHKWRAVVYSAIFFGLAHGVLQQSLITCVVGLVIGLVAVQSGSLLPGVVFHFLHNTLVLTAAGVTSDLLDRWPVLGAVFSPAGNDQFDYHWQVTLLGAIVTLLILWWFICIPFVRKPEEALQIVVEQNDECRMTNVE